MVALAARAHGLYLVALLLAAPAGHAARPHSVLGTAPASEELALVTAIDLKMSCVGAHHWQPGGLPEGSFNLMTYKMPIGPIPLTFEIYNAMGGEGGERGRATRLVNGMGRGEAHCEGNGVSRGIWGPLSAPLIVAPLAIVGAGCCYLLSCGTLESRSWCGHGAPLASAPYNLAIGSVVHLAPRRTVRPVLVIFPPAEHEALRDREQERLERNYVESDSSCFSDKVIRPACWFLRRS